MTTNPSIFQAAIGSGEGYEEQLADLAVRGVTVDEAVRMMTTADVRAAADVLREVYDATDGRDGRVSIEVDPRLAHDTGATIAEAKPAVLAGRPPQRDDQDPGDRGRVSRRSPRSSAPGISVNVTLIFSLERYREVMDAYLAGLEKARAAGLDLFGHPLRRLLLRLPRRHRDRQAPDAFGTEEALALRGKAALANARLAYEAYEDVFAGDRWHALAGARANNQRPLWASTGVKDPAYRDTLYVEELVAPGTVNTMPEATLDATADHGDITGRHGHRRVRAGPGGSRGRGAARCLVRRGGGAVGAGGRGQVRGAWQELLDAVTESLDSKGVDGE